MAEKKITKREVINKMLGESFVQENKIYKEFLEHEIELLDKKNSSKGTSKASQENQAIAKMLLDEMAKLEATGKVNYTITELMQSSEVIQNYVCESGKALSNSKITSILRSMLEGANAPIVNVKDKKNSFYSLAK